MIDVACRPVPVVDIAIHSHCGILVDKFPAGLMVDELDDRRGPLVNAHTEVFVLKYPGIRETVGCRLRGPRMLGLKGSLLTRPLPQPYIDPCRPDGGEITNGKS